MENWLYPEAGALLHVLLSVLDADVVEVRVCLGPGDIADTVAYYVLVASLSLSIYIYIYIHPYTYMYILVYINYSHIEG